MDAAYQTFGKYPHRQLVQPPSWDAPVRAGGWATSQQRKSDSRHNRVERNQGTRRVQQTLRTQSSAASRADRAGMAASQSRRREQQTLSADLLLERAQAESPGDVATARLSGLRLSAVNDAGLPEFANLVHVEAGENALEMASFAMLPRLNALELPLNMVKDIDLPPGSFAALTILDLSFNSISPEAIVALATLPKLRALDLTSNELTSLPLDMSGVCHSHLHAPTPARSIVCCVRKP